MIHGKISLTSKHVVAKKLRLFYMTWPIFFMKCQIVLVFDLSPSRSPVVSTDSVVTVSHVWWTSSDSTVVIRARPDEKYKPASWATGLTRSVSVNAQTSKLVRNEERNWLRDGSDKDKVRPCQCKRQQHISCFNIRNYKLSGDFLLSQN